MKDLRGKVAWGTDFKGISSARIVLGGNVVLLRYCLWCDDYHQDSQDGCVKFPALIGDDI